ncbi:MAG TPA: MetS family NSS transporter small subunit [Longimicrobiales bacterium]|nr:MetS family NSS transporter small subunit [Longimicrobiales bacterium]
MNTSALLTFAVIAGIVWGGLVLIVTTAVRKESRKTDDA